MIMSTYKYQIYQAGCEYLAEPHANVMNNTDINTCNIIAIMTDEIAWFKPNPRVELQAKVSQP